MIKFLTHEVTEWLYKTASTSLGSSLDSLEMLVLQQMNEHLSMISSQKMPNDHPDAQIEALKGKKDTCLESKITGK